jgi:hypothetical protein
MNIQFSVLSDNKQALFSLPPPPHDGDIDDGKKDIYVPPKFTRIFEMVIEIIFYPHLPPSSFLSRLSIEKLMEK